MAQEFYHEEIQAVPAGYQVRTVTHPSGHEVRLAFPPGRRKRGSGRLIEILHPHGRHNPCAASLNPGTAASWNRATEAGRAIALKVAGVPEISPYVNRQWEDLPQNIRAMIQGKQVKNKFDTSREKAAFAAGLTAGSKKLGEAVSKLRSKRASRLERLTRSGLARNPKQKIILSIPGSELPMTKADVDASRIYYAKEIEIDAKVVRFHGPKTKTEAQESVKHFREIGHQASVVKAPQWLISSRQANPGETHKWTTEIRRMLRASKYRHPSPNLKAARQQLAAILLKGKGGTYDESEVRLALSRVGSALSEAGLPQKPVGELYRGNKSSAKHNLDEITQAQKLYEEFSGKPSGKITMINEPVKARDDYAHLGWLQWAAFHLSHDDEGYDPAEVSNDYQEMMDDGATTEHAWNEIAQTHNITVRVFDFQGDEIRLAASPDGNQLYFLGGKQDEFMQHLSSFGTDTTRDRVLLGELIALSYEAKKEQLGDSKPQSYYHVFAEESGEPPMAYWDALTKRIMLVGGNYSLDNAKVGIVN